jgi:hypothetical protein
MSEYQMPKTELGDFVYFYPHPGAEPEIAQVIKPGARALTLWVTAPGFGGMERTSVHHKDDPGVTENAEWAKLGSWEHKPKDSRLSILAEKVSLLERKLEALEPRKGPKGQ